MYSKLFKRAGSTLKSRYRIDVELWWNEIKPWIIDQVALIQENKIETEIDLYKELENMRRSNPTKFYLLELELIKEIRKIADAMKIKSKKSSLSKLGIKEKNRKTDDSDNDEGGGDYIYA